MALSAYQENIPRKLTDSELNRAVKAVDVSYSISPEVANMAVGEIRKHVRAQLSEITITPLGIEEMIEKINLMYHKAIVQPGTPVGHEAAGAINGPSTQMALNSFQSSGVGNNVDGGIDEIKNFMRAPKKPKNITSTIFSSDSSNMTFDDVLDTKKDIVDITVRSMMVDHIVVKDLNPSEREWWVSPFESSRKPDENYTPTVGHWLLRLKFDVSKLFEYKISLEDIAHTIKTTKFNKKDKNVFGKSSCINIRYSPDNLGIIEIIPIPSQISVDVIKTSKGRVIPTNDVEYMTKNFLTLLVVPAMNDIRISGIEGISDIHPQSVDVLTAVNGEHRQNDGTWMILIDKVMTSSNGMTSKNVANLFKAIGFNVAKTENDSIVIDNVNEVVRERVKSLLMNIQTDIDEKVVALNKVKTMLMEYVKQFYPPEDTQTIYDKLVNNKDLNILKDIGEDEKLMIGSVFKSYLIAVDELETAGKDIPKHQSVLEDISNGEFSGVFDFVKEVVASRRKDNVATIKRMAGGKIQFDRNADPVVNSSTVHYAKAVGSNLKELFSYKSVDFRHCYSSDIHEMITTLGILASRKYYVRKFVDMVRSAGEEVDVRYVETTVAYMMTLGKITPVTFGGYSVHAQGSVLSLAAYQSPLTVAAEAASKEQKDELNSVAASQISGQIPKIGTGQTKIFPGLKTDLERIEEELQASMATTKEKIVKHIDVRNLMKKFGIGDPIPSAIQPPHVVPRKTEIISWEKRMLLFKVGKNPTQLPGGVPVQPEFLKILDKIQNFITTKGDVRQKRLQVPIILSEILGGSKKNVPKVQVPTVLNVPKVQVPTVLNVPKVQVPTVLNVPKVQVPTVLNVPKVPEIIELTVEEKNSLSILSSYYGIKTKLVGKNAPVIDIDLELYK
jgi:hypothetical protein